MWPWLRFHGLRHEALRGVPISDENVSFQNVTLFPENGWFIEFSLNLLLVVNGAAVYAAKRLHGQLQQLLAEIRPQKWAEPEKLLVQWASETLHLGAS